ncbi:MAG: glutamine-hydrolyzing GMP synthase, partial [Ignavibacteria bacterium]|nr:glutamine-hydrolyzing GMP synthase [Ignavibacteria bacterium]
MKHPQKILILDFGSQYTQLIARRIRESKVYSEIHPSNYSIEKIKESLPQGIILSGGPMSVYDEDSPKISKEIFELGVPVLGICYGLQLIAINHDGKVEQAKDREYGKVNLEISAQDLLLDGVTHNSIVWMSHGDLITKVPSGFNVTANSENTPVCSISNPDKKIYGLQFHPEVAHTEEGKKIINNFLFNICKCKPDWTPENFINSTIEEIRTKIGSKKAICALSGGVDSSVAAILISKAIGENLICIHVDTGLMRKNESAAIVKMFNDNYDLHVISIDASELFLNRLDGVSVPESKRRIIGN